MIASVHFVKGRDKPHILQILSFCFKPSLFSPIQCDKKWKLECLINLKTIIWKRYCSAKKLQGCHPYLRIPVFFILQIKTLKMFHKLRLHMGADINFNKVYILSIFTSEYLYKNKGFCEILTIFNDCTLVVVLFCSIQWKNGQNIFFQINLWPYRRFVIIQPGLNPFFWLRKTYHLHLFYFYFLFL